MVMIYLVYTNLKDFSGKKIQALSWHKKLGVRES